MALPGTQPIQRLCSEIEPNPRFEKSRVAYISDGEQYYTIDLAVTLKVAHIEPIGATVFPERGFGSFLRLPVAGLDLRRPQFHVQHVRKHPSPVMDAFSAHLFGEQPRGLGKAECAADRRGPTLLRCLLR